MLLVVAHSKAARQSVRNACNAHEDVVVWRFGRAVLFEETAFGAFLAQRFRHEFDSDVQVERTLPFNEFRSVPEDVREAAAAYADRADANTPYAKFAAGTEHPSPAALRDRDLDPGLDP
ncbi:MAG: hypothetical protein ABEJ08_00940 [Halobacteriaceae archaeon]